MKNAEGKSVTVSEEEDSIEYRLPANWPFPVRNQLQSVILDMLQHGQCSLGPAWSSIFSVQNSYYHRFTGKPPPTHPHPFHTTRF